MIRHSITKMIDIMGRVILSVVLFTSGISKVLNIDAFSEQVIQYSVLYIHPILADYSKFISVFICCIEIALSVGVWVSKLRFVASFVMFLLFIFFLYLTGVNYLYPTSLGSIESCRCFGELFHFPPKMAFYKNILFLFISLLVLFRATVRRRENSYI